MTVSGGSLGVESGVLGLHPRTIQISLAHMIASYSVFRNGSVATASRIFILHLL